MYPEISEFSYGFALTNELVGWAELRAAPIFPSLLEEGKAGGGYDVKLDRPGAPLYLQFKRSECMTRGSSREVSNVSAAGGVLSVPYYRFSITDAAKSDQHELLLALDTGPNHVFYVAPRFHRLTEINDAWNAGAVASRSTFVPPNVIGPLGGGSHTVAFDFSSTWVCSQPKAVHALTSREVLEKMRKALADDDRPFGDRISELVPELRDAERRGRERIREKDGAATRDTKSTQAFDRILIPPLVGARDQLEAPEAVPPAIRKPATIDPRLVPLREAADIAIEVFDALLVVVQPDT